MANPNGNEANLRKYQPKWKHGQTTVIRVPVALVNQIMDYAHKLDDNDSLLQVDRQALETLAKKLSKKSEIPKSWQVFIDRILELQTDR